MDSTQGSAPDDRPDQHYDLLIKGGEIYDGEADRTYRADVGVCSGLIEAVGDLSGRADTTINAQDRLVSPGFIDIHTHCDDTFRNNRVGPGDTDVNPVWKGNLNHLFQGVTTVVTGNCGQGYVDVSHWLGLADTLGLGCNVCHLIPHGDFTAPCPTYRAKDELTSTTDRPCSGQYLSR